MSIFGIGTDIISVNRIKNSLKNSNFINRIFNEKEIFKCKIRGIMSINFLILGNLISYFL